MMSSHVGKIFVAYFPPKYINFIYFFGKMVNIERISFLPRSFVKQLLKFQVLKISDLKSVVVQCRGSAVLEMFCRIVDMPKLRLCIHQIFLVINFYSASHDN